MAKILQVHNCIEKPRSSDTMVVESAANGWILAKQDGGVLETVVVGIKGCPFCCEKLPKGGNL